MSFTAPYVIFLIFLILVVPYGSAFLHELGHAVCALLAGATHVTSFGLGTSRPFAVGSFRGIRIYLCSRRPSQGIAFYLHPQLLPSRRRQVFTLAGGVLMHFLIVGTAWTFYLLWPKGALVWGIVGGVNLWMGLFNLLPIRVRLGSYTLHSDGAQILTVLRTGATSPDPTSPLSSLQAFRELWQATGDKQMLYAHLIAAGNFWVSVGDMERGGELLAEARALPFEPLAAWRSYGILVEAEAALERNDLERAAVVLRRRKSISANSAVRRACSWQAGPARNCCDDGANPGPR